MHTGVVDDGEIIGINNLDEELTRLSNMMRDSIRPDILMNCSTQPESIDGKTRSRKEIQDELGVSQSTAIRLLKELETQGHVKRVGDGKHPLHDLTLRADLPKVSKAN